MNDASDPTIRFDVNGYCNYCTEALGNIGKIYFPNDKGGKLLSDTIAMIKRDGKGKPYDCIMGLSGSLDSLYLLYLGHKWGLRVLGVHIDDGYDTEISKQNIKKLILASGIKMKTIVPDAEQYNDLTRAYMKAGVPNLAVPQDNILYAFAKKYHIILQTD